METKVEKQDNKVAEAMAVIRQAMIDDDPGSPGSYAYSWHCNIAMSCYDAIRSADCSGFGREHALRVGNDAATRFMKLLFGVDTKGPK